MGSQETVQTSDAPVEAVITRGSTGRTETVSSAPVTRTTDPADTLTGLVVIGLVGFVLWKFLRG